MNDCKRSYANISPISVDGSESSNDSVSIDELNSTPPNKNGRFENQDVHNNNITLDKGTEEIQVPVSGTVNEFRSIPLTEIGTLHYKSLQAVAFNMNLPANVKRKELLGLIVARKKGQENIVKGILAEIVKDRASRRLQTGKPSVKKIKLLTNVANRYSVSNLTAFELKSTSDTSPSGSSHEQISIGKRLSQGDCEESLSDSKRQKANSDEENIVEILDDDVSSENMNTNNEEQKTRTWCEKFLLRSFTPVTYTCTKTCYDQQPSLNTVVLTWYETPLMTRFQETTLYNPTNEPGTRGYNQNIIPEFLRNIYYDLLQNNNINYEDFKDAFGNHDLNKILDYVMCTETELETYKRELFVHGNIGKPSRGLPSKALPAQINPNIKISCPTNVAEPVKPAETATNILINSKVPFYDKTYTLYCVMYRQVATTFVHPSRKPCQEQKDNSDASENSVEVSVPSVPQYALNTFIRDVTISGGGVRNNAAEFIDFNDLPLSITTCITSSAGSEQDSSTNTTENLNSKTVNTQVVGDVVRRDPGISPQIATKVKDPTVPSETTLGALSFQNHDFTILKRREPEILSDFNGLDSIKVTCSFDSHNDDIHSYTEDFSDVTFSNVNSHEELMIAQHLKQCVHLNIQCPFLYTLCGWFDVVPMMPKHIRKMHPEKIVRKERAQYDIDCGYLEALRNTGVKIVQQFENRMFFVSLNYDHPNVYISVQEVCESELQHAARVQVRLIAEYCSGTTSWTGETNTMDKPLSQYWNNECSLVLSPTILQQFHNRHFKLLVEIGI